MNAARLIAGLLLSLVLTARAGDEPVLRTAAAVHRLKASEAIRQIPVEIEGVITHFHHRLGDGFFFQDETDGIYVKLFGLKPEVRSGDRVRITGVTGAGDYAPIVRLQTWEKLGQGKLPKPEVVTAAELATGRHDSRRVELRGIVRSAQPALRTAEAHLALQLRADGKDLLVGVNEYSPASTNLTDAIVVVRGVAAGVFSRQRQLLAPVVVVETDADVQVIAPPQRAEDLPVIPIESLFGYRPDGFPERRVRVRGTLLGHQPGRWLAVRDGTSGLFVQTEDAAALQPGDTVELFGFPEVREQSLWLMRATVRRLGVGQRPLVLPGTVVDGLQNPCELRSLMGELMEQPRPGDGSWVLSLRADNREFEAWVPAGGGAYPAAWRPGAQLEVTGITEPFSLPGHRLQMIPFPQGLRLHARSAADVLILKPAPWWTAPNVTRWTLWVLLGVLCLLGSVTAVALVLARKNAALREARAELRAARDELARRYTARTGEWQEELAARHAAEADFALLTAERTRLARELHDTLEQTLASVALQLDAARGFFREQPAESERLLIAATEQLRDSQAEVRRSVWNLRSVKLEEATLPEALRQLAKALADAHGPVVSVECDGTPEHIPPGVASHLFRVAQEAVTNALKHAQARAVRITLAFTPDGLELAVADDGRGFDTAAVKPDGHFGLRGLRERAAAVGGELAIKSAPGQGTRVEVKVPRARLSES